MSALHSAFNLFCILCLVYRLSFFLAPLHFLCMNRWVKKNNYFENWKNMINSRCCLKSSLIVTRTKDYLFWIKFLLLFQFRLWFSMDWRLHHHFEELMIYNMELKTISLGIEFFHSFFFELKNNWSMSKSKVIFLKLWGWWTMITRIVV
jgi:hypothetical protein